MTPRVVAAATVACLLGLSCYGLVWLRTSEGAPFLEARVQSIADLAAVISGRQFHRHLFRFTPRELVMVRVPLIARWIGAELRWPGLLLAAAAILGLMRSRAKEIGLLAGCAAIVTAFALNYDVYDVQVFLIIPLIALGLLAALGANLLVERAERLPPTAAFAAAMTVLLIPAAQYQANIRANNQRRHTYEARFFDALFDQLPDRSALVSESYPIDHMVLYKLIAEHAARGRRIELIKDNVETIAEYVDNGFTVFAFIEGRAAVEFEGVPFETAAFRLPSPSPIRHVLDSESQDISYGLSMVTLPTAQAHNGNDSSNPDRLEPMTGAVWRALSQ